MRYSQSTPESWAQHSHDNIVRAEHERMASVELRALIDNVLNDTSRDMNDTSRDLHDTSPRDLDDTSRDMKEQADAVDAAFQKRVVEVDNAKMALEENLRKVSIGLLRSTYVFVRLSNVFIELSFTNNRSIAITMLVKIAALLA